MAIISILTKFRNWVLSEDPDELAQYLKGALESIKKSQTDLFQVRPPVEFELAVVNTKDKGGKFRIIVADVNVKYETQYISKIKISYGYR